MKRSIAVLKPLALFCMWIVVLISCEEQKRDNETIYETRRTYFPVPRDCNDMFLRRCIHTRNPYEFGKYEISADEFALYIFTGLSYEDYFNHKSVIHSYDYITSPDEDIEDAIKEFYYRSAYPFMECKRGPLCVYHEYRKERCISFKISSEVPLFGRAAGSDVSDKFRLIGTGLETTSFIFDSDKVMIDPNVVVGMTIDEYLSYDPLIFGEMNMKLAESPEEVPVETRFIVDIELEGGKMLTDTLAVKLL